MIPTYRTLLCPKLTLFIIKQYIIPFLYKEISASLKKNYYRILQPRNHVVTLFLIYYFSITRAIYILTKMKFTLPQTLLPAIEKHDKI